MNYLGDFGRFHTFHNRFLALFTTSTPPSAVAEKNIVIILGTQCYY